MIMQPLFMWSNWNLFGSDLSLTCLLCTSYGTVRVHMTSEIAGLVNTGLAHSGHVVAEPLECCGVSVVKLLHYTRVGKTDICA